MNQKEKKGVDGEYATELRLHSGRLRVCLWDARGSVPSELRPGLFIRTIHFDHRPINGYDVRVTSKHLQKVHTFRQQFEFENKQTLGNIIQGMAQ